MADKGMTTPKQDKSHRERDAADPLPGDPAGESRPLEEPPADQGAETQEIEEAASEPDPASELARWRDLAHRSAADLENYRKRMAREKTEAIKFANASLLEDLLPVLDNFQLGLEAARGQADAPDAPSKILQGMTMVFKQIEDFLLEHGVEEINADASPFDPNLHEAVGQQHSAEVPEGHVIQQLRKGYKLKDRLLRAANVVVSRGPDPSPKNREA